MESVNKNLVNRLLGFGSGFLVVYGFFFIFYLLFGSFNVYFFDWLYFVV